MQPHLSLVIFDQSALVNYLQMAGVVAIGLFLLAHVAATAVGLPGTILVIAGGAAFGVIWGTLWSTIGATLGAIAAFYLARCLMRDWVERRFGHHRALQRLNQMVQGHNLSCVLALRFAPISPFNLVNFWFGLTPIRLKPYAIGTFIGIIPGTAAYTWLGASGMKVFHGEGWRELAGALSILALLSVLPIWLRRWKR